VSLIFTITEHPRVHAETVIGADGAAGYDCPDFTRGCALGEMLATDCVEKLAKRPVAKISISRAEPHLRR
jgi:hypothetical protein